MRPVVTVVEMRALDRATIDQVGLPAVTLMETAGRAVAAMARQLAQTGHFAVVCGPGNNGGDGFVAARVLRDHCVDAVVYLAAKREDVRGDSRKHLDILERAGCVVRMIDTAEALGELGPTIAGAAVAIDALFGVGLTRPIDGHLAAVVAAINAAPIRLAVDLPSGLDADTGRVLGVAVEAHHTVTMAALKIALVSAPGFARCGVVTVADIGVPAALIAASSLRAGLVEAADVARSLPASKALDHKGTRGHVLVVGGSPGMRGAGRLAATAALRSGAGLVTLAADGDGLVAPDPVMTRTLTGALGSSITGKAAIVIGCGLGTSDQAAARVREVLSAGVPAVLDADALTLVASLGSGLDAIAAARGPIVITPHPGEAGRLLGIPAVEVESDRLAAARALAVKTRAIVVLKGARTIICDGTRGGDHCSINPTGGPALATGGTGDVLAGTIGGLLAQSMPPVDAARAAVFVHGLAGEELAASFGARGVIASDLPLAIAAAIRSL